jgi:hypothetical protein
MKKPREAKRMSDNSAKERTGKVWAEWFKILDTAGAQKWRHKEIALYLYEKHKVSEGRAQTVSVGYEQERRLREKFKNCAGEFSANCSCTLGVPRAKMYKAWTHEKLRRCSLPSAQMEITPATPEKSLRARGEGDTRRSVYFNGRPGGKTQVAVDPRKLASSNGSLKMNSYRSSALNRLEKILQD